MEITTSLFLFLTIVAAFLPSGGSNLTTITISKSGLDTPSCLTDQEESCHSLNYTLKQMEETQPSQDVMIIVTYPHTISPVNVTYSTDLNLTLITAGSFDIHCTHNGYVHVNAPYTVKQVNVSISIDGVHFIGCQGHSLGDSKVYGFHFSNIDTFLLQNSIISNSSDLVLERTRTVYIGNSKFLDNVFFYGQISLVQQLGPNGGGPPLSSSYLIEDTSFINNIGQSQSASIPTATLAYYIQSVDSNYTAIGRVKRCVFSNNSVITGGSPVFPPYRTIAEIGIMVPFGEANSISLSFEENLFYNDYGSYGRIIWAGLYTPIMKEFQINSTSNVFKNNSVSTNGQMIALYFSGMTQTTVRIMINNNTMDSNIGAGINIDHYNVTRPGLIYIRDSVFSNSEGKAIALSRSFCPYEMLSMVNITNITVTNNSISSFSDNGVVSITNQTVYLSNSAFINNTGTALYVQDTILVPSGQLAFTHNVGRNGGGVAISTDTTVQVNSETSVEFIDNVALYGAAVYIGVQRATYCFMIDPDCKLSVHSKGNKASSSGSNLFLQDPNIMDYDCLYPYITKCFNITNEYNNPQLGFGSSVSTISSILSDTKGNTITLFPGQNIITNASLYGAFGEQSSCVATVYLSCDNQIISCQGSDGDLLQLQGSAEITLSHKIFTSDLKLLSTSITNFKQFPSPTIHFQCFYSNEALLNLNIVSCPLGFQYNQSTTSCQCTWTHHNGYICSLAAGKVCIVKGYWYGKVKVEDQEFFVMEKCPYINCKQDNEKCPTSVGPEEGTSTYIMLPNNRDDQCNNNRGGVLCARCNNEATLSFEGMQCIPLKNCKPWQPYLLLVLVILFQLVLSALIIILISTTFSFGLGYLYGPLFFIAVINRLSFGYYAEFHMLKVITSFYTSVFLLNMEVFGEIPWCFFSSLTLLEEYAFHYLGPLIVGLVLLVSVIVARKWPRLHRKVTASPLHAICIFLLLSFWSLSDTSIRILQLIRFTSDSLTTIRVAIDPEIVFFTGIHIPLALIAISILLVIVLPFILVLLLSPCLSVKINCVRIKPLLDQFQSCCQDKYRWYPGIYMVVWILILTVDDFIIAVQLILVLVAGLHFLIQPYQYKWLNAIDTLLFCDLILLASFVNEKTNPAYIYNQDEWIGEMIVICTYIFTIIPLIAFLLGAIFIILSRFKVFNLLKKRTPSRKMTVLTHSEPINTRKTDLTEPPEKQIKKVLELQESAQEYREPLLALLSDEEQLLPQQYGSNTQ